MIADRSVQMEPNKTPEKILNAFNKYLADRRVSEEDFAACSQVGAVAIDSFCWHREAGEVFDTIEAFVFLTRKIFPGGAITLRRRDIPSVILDDWRRRLEICNGERIDPLMLQKWSELLHPLYFSPFVVSEYVDAAAIPSIRNA